MKTFYVIRDDGGGYMANDTYYPYYKWMKSVHDAAIYQTEEDALEAIPKYCAVEIVKFISK